MPFAYRFDNPEGAYFVTFTVVEWVDVFTRNSYADIVIESLRFCIRKKGLRIHAWVIMSSHLHLIISRTGKEGFSDIIRDFKKYTADQIIAAIQAEPESRRNWMLWLFKSAGKKNSNNNPALRDNSGSRVIIRKNLSPTNSLTRSSNTSTRIL